MSTVIEQAADTQLASEIANKFLKLCSTNRPDVTMEQAARFLIIASEHQWRNVYKTCKPRNNVYLIDRGINPMMRLAIIHTILQKAHDAKGKQ